MISIFGSHFPSLRTAVFCAALGGILTVQSCTPPRVLSFSWDPVVHLSGPSVVSITAWRSGPSEHAEVFRGAPFPARGLQASVGSGVVFKKEGLILTNQHIVRHASRIRVELSNQGGSFLAEQIGGDDRADVALLRLIPSGQPKGSKLNLPEIKWGNSESLEVGESVLAIGNPYGFSQTASAGVVSALERVAPIGLVDPLFGVGEADTLLQTDASIHPGSSGGPLLNRKGEMIGLTTLFFSRTGEPSGISFAIPVSRLRYLAEQLWSSGSVRRAWVGLSAQDVDLDLSVYLGGYGSGVLVTEVIPGSPADGVLRAGDLVFEVDDSPVRGLLSFRQRVQAGIPGMDLPLKFIRNQKEMHLSIRPILPVDENLVVTTRARQRAGQARAGQVARYQPQLLGMTLAEVPQSWLLMGRRERRESIKTPGAWIVDLATSSPALEAGVLPGDWLLEVNGVPLEGPNHFGKIPSDMTGDLLLSIRRGGPGGQKIYRLVRS